MSQSYRKLYCGNTVSGEKTGEKADKQRSSRLIRHANKIKVAEASGSEDNEPKKPYKTKKSVERYTFAKDGMTSVDPESPGSFHVKRVAKKKIRMIK